MDLITTKKRKDLPRQKRKRLIKIQKGENPKINHQRKEAVPKQKKESKEGDPHQERQIGFHVSISKRDIAIMATAAISGIRHFASISKKENVTREISVHSCIRKTKTNNRAGFQKIRNPMVKITLRPSRRQRPKERPMPKRSDK